jgi:hypothetical protein
MAKLKVGDRVKYQGEHYYIVEGPHNAALGYMYTLSKTPPPIRVLEQELDAAPESESRE